MTTPTKVRLMGCPLDNSTEESSCGCQIWYTTFAGLIYVQTLLEGRDSERLCWCLITI